MPAKPACKRVSATAQAFETLRLLIAPGMSRRTRKSQFSRLRRRSPLPSPPSTSAIGRRKGVFAKLSSASEVEAEAQIAHVPQSFERAGEIDHSDDRDMFEAAGSRFCHDARHLRGVAVRHDHGIDAKGRRGAQDRADIVRVGDLIEHEHDAASRYDIGEIERRQRQGFEHHPLMHGARAKTAREVLGRHDMGTKASPRDFGFEPPGGGFRGINIEDFSALAAQGLAHGMKAVKNSKTAGRAPEHRPLGRMALPACRRPDGSRLGPRASLWPGWFGVGDVRRFFDLAGCARPRA